jgi:phage terminase large subunit-like protein
MDCPATVQAVRELSAKWPGWMAKLIEDKANGSAVIQMLTREISGILPVNPEGGKIACAAGVSPLIEAGNIYLPHPLWAHDDQVDAMTRALLRWNMVAPQQEIIYYSEPYQISSI